MDISCALSALFFFTANAIKVAYYRQELQKKLVWAEYFELNGEYLEDEWSFRESEDGLWLSSGLMTSFSWLFLAYPIIQMAWLLSNGGKQAIMFNCSIVVFAFGGAFTEWLGNLFWLGMTMASQKIASEFSLDDWARDDIGPGDDRLGWKALEINYIIGSGFVWFTDCFEWLCLSGIFLSTFCSVYIWRKTESTTFGDTWNYFGLMLAFFCLIEFILEILRFEGIRRVGLSALLMSAFNRLVFIPAWILTLGCMLPKANRRQSFVDTDPIASELLLAVSQRIGDDNNVDVSSPAGRFSIDETEEESLPVLTTPASPPPEAFARPSISE